jgi:membrane-associated phospholipid phosphatase
VSATKPATGTDGLAATGVDVLGGAGAGALAVLLGTVILWTARRKGRHAR